MGPGKVWLHARAPGSGALSPARRGGKAGRGSLLAICGCPALQPCTSHRHRAPFSTVPLPAPVHLLRTCPQLNELHNGLLMACTADGSVRVWRDYTLRGQQRLATAWQVCINVRLRSS